MSTWVIGDIHGCWHTLEHLLATIDWQPARDRLWLVGDLVNRGPDSLTVLRWARRHEDSVQVVLGNHDLHLLGRAHGLRRAKPGDRLQQILEAADGPQLIAWLGRRPLLHREAPWVVVHAGLHPSWTLVEAAALAGRIQARLAEGGGFAALYARRKAVWRPGLEGDEALAAALDIFVRIRVVDVEGRPRSSFSGAPDAAPAGTRPWYDGCRALGDGTHVIFGHWAMAGLERTQYWTCLDSACVWGGRLSALCVQEQRLVSVPAAPGDAISWSKA